MSKISIRKLEPSDKRFFSKWWRDKELLGLTSGLMKRISDTEVDKYFNSMLDSIDDLHYMILLDNKIIGHVNLAKNTADWYETQIIIGEREYRGKGYGPMAIMILIDLAKKLGISKIFLEVRPTNMRAVKAYKKCGFVNCGIIKLDDNKGLSEVLRMEYRNKQPN